MSRSPLSLEQYFFSKIRVEHNPDFQPEAFSGDALNDVTLKVGLQFAPHPEDDGHCRIILYLHDFTCGEISLPYNLEVEVTGFFSFDPHHQDVERLVQVNGASMLYTAAREFVLLITGRGPWGAFALPTVNFHALIPKSQRKRPEERQHDSTDD